MANWLRLRRQSHAPREQDGTETIYAAADGTLMHMDPEGSETELGTGGDGGSLPEIDSPLDLTGCVAWYDASQLEGLNDDDPVPTWPDLSGSGFDGENDESDEQGVYKTDVQNGLPVVRLDPTSNPQYYSITGDGLDILREVPGCTIAYAGRSNDAGSGAVFWVSDGDGNGLIRATGYLNGPAFAASNDDAIDGAAGTPAMNEIGGSGFPFMAAVGVCDFNYQYGPISTIIAHGLTARPFGMHTSDLFPANTPDTPSDNVCIGATTTDHDAISGDLGEIVVYNRALTSDEQEQLLAYLAAKWDTY